MEKEKSNQKIILGVQIILIILGTILACILFFKSLKEPTLLGVLGSITFLATYLIIILYATKYYNKKENNYFQMVLYAYASVLGIQILQSGNYISDYGLTQNIAILINCCNLISFANIIKFADNLLSPKIALSYMIIVSKILL